MLLYNVRSFCLPAAVAPGVVVVRGRRKVVLLCRAAAPADTVKEVRGGEVEYTSSNLVAFDEELSQLQRFSGEERLRKVQEETDVDGKAPSLFQQLGDALAKIVDGSDRTTSLVLLNVMTFIMATNWVVVKDAETMLDPFTFSALRFSIAAVAFIPFLSRAMPIDKQVMKAGIELGIWCALGYITQSLGLLTTDASRASFLSAFTVILVPIIAGFSGKGVSRTTWSAAIVALLGTTMLEQGGGTPPGVGDAFSIMSAAFFAIQIIRTEHYSRTMTGQTIGLLAASLGTTAIVSVALALGLHPAESVQLAQNFSTAGIPWKEIMYTGVFSTDLVLFIELVALNNVSSTDAAIVYTMEPVLGALMAYCLLGERWGPLGWVGASLILISSLSTQILGDRENSNTAEEQ